MLMKQEGRREEGEEREEEQDQLVEDAQELATSLLTRYIYCYRVTGPVLARSKGSGEGEGVDRLVICLLLIISE